MGKDAIIKNITLEMLNDSKQIPDIYFGFVGKLSPAHEKAAKVANKKLKAKFEMTIKEILKILKKTEVGKRLKNT